MKYCCGGVSIVKGYLRKGASLVAIKEYSRAADVYQKAIDLDANCQEAIDAYRTWVELHSLTACIHFVPCVVICCFLHWNAAAEEQQII